MWRVLLLLGMLAGLAGAQETASPPDGSAVAPAKRELVLQIIAIIEPAKLNGEIETALIADLERRYPQILEQVVPGLTRPEDEPGREAHDRAVTESFQRVAKRFRELYVERIQIARILEEIYVPLAMEITRTRNSRTSSPSTRTPTRARQDIAHHDPVGPGSHGWIQCPADAPAVGNSSGGHGRGKGRVAKARSAPGPGTGGRAGESAAARCGQPFMNREVRIMEPQPATVPEAPEQAVQLSEHDRERIDAIKRQTDLSQNQAVLQFGVDVQGKISHFADQVLGEVRAKDAGAVGDMLTDLLLHVKSVKVHRLAEGPGFLASLPLVGGLFDRIKRFMAEYQSLSTQIDRITGHLDKARNQLLQDVALLDKLFEQNVLHFKDLEIYIQAGEEKLADFHRTILSEARRRPRAAAIPSTSSAPTIWAGWPTASKNGSTT